MPSLAAPSGSAGLPWWREPTAAQWTNYLAAWAGWVLDGFDFCVYLFALTKIQEEFGVKATSTFLSITLTLAVRLLGGVAAGWVADRYGRRLPLMLSILWFALFDAAVAFAPTFAWVLVFRTLFGFGMGAEWTAGSAIAMESWPARSRGLASGVLQGSWGVGYVLAAAAYAAVVPAHGWRPLFLLAAVPALLVVPIRLLVKEPARGAAARAPAAPAPRLAAFAPRIVWGCVLYAFSFAVYYALAAPWPRLLQTELHLAAPALLLPSILLNVGMLFGAITIGAAAGRFGVVRAQVIPLLLLFPALPLFVGAAGAGAGLWAGAFLAGFLGAGISGVTPYLFAALFPAEVRARSFGIVYHVGALLSGGTPLLIAWLAQSGQMALSRALAGTAALSALITIGLLVLRPRGILPAEVLGRRPAR
jgi:SHS family lactate transporter-like MFS transporter